jgi:hypothetical protein
LGGDFENVTGGVGQVEQNFGGSEGIALEADAVVDLLGGRAVVLGAGLEGAESGAQRERGGRGFKFRKVIGRDPVTKIGGAKREGAAGINARRDVGAGLAALGEEGRGGAGVVEESERLVGLVEALGHAIWFERTAGGRAFAEWGAGKWLRRWAKNRGRGGDRRFSLDSLRPVVLFFMPWETQFPPANGF